eukprot:INCI5014.20.p2 GENE.INCI5014.20~~INCI5014.20.p2  ORF type:complete len:480 (+),score=92.47 INCI5014.20:1634-3073(+)
MEGPVRVAVVGAGLVGPLAALLLQKEGPGRGLAPAVTLFERDAGPWTRDQGTSLDLGGKALSALARAGVEKEVSDASRRNSAAMLVLKPNGQEIMRMEVPAFLAKMGPEPNEVNRNELRSCLLKAFEAAGGDLRWGCDIVAGSLVDDDNGSSNGSSSTAGPVTLTAQDGSSVGTFDVVIVATGSNHCRLRDLIFDDSGHTPFTGYATVQGFVLDPAVSAPEAHVLAGSGSAMICGDSNQTSMFTMRYASDEADQRLCFYVSCPMPTPRSLRDDVASCPGDDVSSRARAWAERRLSSDEWSPALRQLVAAADWCVMRNFYQQPARPVLRAAAMHTPVITIGDALHAMLPHQGAGVNTGMLDAVDVADAVLAAAARCRSHAEVVAKLRATEKRLVARSGPLIQASFDACTAFHAPRSGDDVSRLRPFMGGTPVRLLLSMRKVELLTGTDHFWPGVGAAIVATSVAACIAWWWRRGRAASSC